MNRVRVLLLAGLLTALGIATAVTLWSVNTAQAMPPSVFRVTVTNLTDPPTALSAGALVAHCADGAFWSEGGTASTELVQIAEHGDPVPAVGLEQEETAMGMTFLQERYAIGAVAPGESASVEVVFEYGCKLSTAHQLVGSEDSFVGANSIGMWDPDTHLPKLSVSAELMAFDAGSRADGAATAQPIASSDSWTGVQASIVIEYVTEDPASMRGDAQDEDQDRILMPNTGSGGLADPANRPGQGALLPAVAVYGLGMVGVLLTVVWTMRRRWCLRD